MKKERKIILILSIVIIILTGIIYILVSKNRIVKSNKIIIKEMTQTEYESQINILNASHNEYATNVENYKKAIATAVTSQGISTSYTDAQETIVTNIGKIFEERTKIDDSVAAIADNLSEGKTAYVNGMLITGTGVDNKSFYDNGYSTGYAEGLAASSDNMEVVYTYHYHDDSCPATCTITTDWNPNSKNNDHCKGDSSTSGHTFNCYTATVTHSACGEANSKTVKHMGTVNSSGSCPSDTRTTHTYYTCGYSDGEIIEVKLVPKSN